MNIRNLDAGNEAELAFVEKLYIDSFPPSERRPFETMIDLHRNHSLFDINLIVDEDKFVGFLTYWNLDSFVFAEHFAISSELRNGGYGYKTMSAFIELVDGLPIILEVELPNTILSERRIGFYQRIGFKLWEGIQYQQPAYIADSNAIPMKLMSYGSIDVSGNITDIRNAIYKEVYDC